MAKTRTRKTPDGAGLVELDQWLAPYADRLRARYQRYLNRRAEIEQHEPSLADFSLGHRYFGLNPGERGGQPGVWYREWAPAADALFLTGDFNGWDRGSHPLTKNEFGVWSIFLPDAEYADRLTHGSRVKVHVHSAIGPRDRVPAYIRRAAYDEHTRDFCGQYWQPPEPFAWQNERPKLTKNLRIYEAHVGMSLEEERVATYREFADRVLWRIEQAGYNAVQLMAIQEHPYYGSFGYQVSNFFAPSSRFGTPEELKMLIDAAHGRGLLVFIDLVHSHAVKNIHEGLNHFDGTDSQYFHAGSRGQHPAWDSLCFDYGKYEVLRFLLSNVRYWLEDFNFDGFRFDGVTSMIYHDHGLGRAFTGYDDYFAPHVEEDAVTYLQLANSLIREFRPHAITIAEDVSGMAGIARPVDEGGVGFDYRLAMSVPDYWIKLLKDQRDEDWHMEGIYHELINRRHGEKHVAYAESHDQALVGDKTIAFRLMDADMYFHMVKGSQNIVVERGMALHKMIRLITFTLGGEAYLNFMGNEFGHPEWIDFPREGNGYSYKYARRQWSLLDNPMLRFADLAAFDRAMLKLDDDYGVLADPLYQMIQVHEERKLLVFRRGPLVFAFNFHPAASYADHRIGAPDPCDYRLILYTDDLFFGGHANLITGETHAYQDVPWDDRKQSLQLYLPARTALALAPI